MMALSPVVYIPPGCSQYCTRSVIARPGNSTFAYASDKSITLYTKVNHSIQNFTKSSVVEELNNNAANGCQGGSLNIINNGSSSSTNANNAPTQTKGAVLTTPAYELTCTYGDHMHGDIICFDYNDECVACIIAQTHEVYMWKLINAESITQSKISPNLASTFEKEGKPITMVLVGKHHIVFGTEHGKLISLNTNEHHEPRVVAIPFNSNSDSDNKTVTRAPSTSQLLSGSNNTNILSSTSLTSTAPTNTTIVVGNNENPMNNPPNLPVPSLFTPHASSNSPERNSVKSSPLPQTPPITAEQNINTKSYNKYDDSDSTLRVTCVGVSPLRADTIVAGTANGMVAFCTLSSSAGLRITSTLQPFSQMNNKSDTNTELLPISFVCFSPHTAQHVLVGSAHGALALCDSTSNSIITNFDYKECGMLRGIAWSLEESEVFYTISGQSNKINKWNVKITHPISSFAPVSTSYCVVNLSFVEKDKLLLALQDGSVRVVSVTANSQASQTSSSEINNTNSNSNTFSCQTEFSTHSNHTGCIRHCVLSRYDADLMATSGLYHHDDCKTNTVKVWNLRQMQLIYSINVGDVLVTSLAWAPNGQYLAVGLHSGEVVIYHCNSQKEVSRHLIFTNALHQLIWSPPSEEEELEQQKQEQLGGTLVTASRDAGVALLNVKESRIIHRWSLPPINTRTNASQFNFVNSNTVSDQITCMDVQSMHGKHIAVGCESGKVHLFSLGSTQSTPSLSWSTYGNVITSLAFCPVASQFVLTGSADGIVRLYDTSLKEPRLITSNVREFALHNTSHGSNKAISCVAWCSLAPYLILSSSQDGFIYVWDIRTSLCIYSTRGHTSQINCLVSHEERPLIFISAGVDGAIMAWSLNLLRQVELEAAMGSLESNFVADASSLMSAVNSTTITTSHPRKELSLSSVTGVAVQKLLQELRETNTLHTTSTVNRVAQIVNFFDFPHGAMDLASFVPYATDAKTFTASANTESGKSLIIYPTSKLTELQKDKVKMMSESVQRKENKEMNETQKREVIEVAYEMMKVGQLEECCRLLMEVKEYDKALALAPMVSVSYWKELCKKIASALEDDGDERAVQYYVACEESVKAAQLLARNAPSKVNEAIVLCETCIQNNSTSLTANNSITPSPESTEEKAVSSGHGKKKTKDKESRRSTSIRTETVPVIPPVPMATSLNLTKAELAGLSLSVNMAPNTNTSKSKSRENVNESDMSKDDVINTSNNINSNSTRKRSSDTKALSHAKKGLLIQRALYIAQACHVNGRLLAAAMLISGAHDTCVQMLQNNGDIMLSYLLVHAIPIRAQCSIDVAYWQAMLQSAHMHKWESALKCAIRYSNQYHSLATLCAYYQYSHLKSISSVFDGSSNNLNEPTNQEQQTNKATRIKASNDKVITFMNLIRQECTQLQLPLDAALIQQRHAADGLASQNQLAAMILTMDLTNFTSTNTKNSSNDNQNNIIPIMTLPVLLQSASGFMESLLSAALQDIDSVNAQFYLRQALNVSSYVSLPVVMGNETSDSNNTNKVKTAITNISSSSVPLSLTSPDNASLASTGGNYLSSDQRKFLALTLTTAALFCVKIYRFPKLLNPTFAKAREMANGHASVEALLTKLQSQLATYSPHSTEVNCNCVGAHIPIIDAQGKLYTSVLTNEPIRGPLYVLEDGISYTSREEMLQWTMCCHFSPLLTGARVVAL